MKHPVVWHIPKPLWSYAIQDSAPVRFRRPELLRFATDSFMEDLQAELSKGGAALRDFVAQRETWRTRAVGWQPEASGDGAPVFNSNAVVKLYQPAHQRFYLVAASLVCQVRGLPDKRIAAEEEETVSFVIRRVVTGATEEEYGWFGDAGWKPINTAAGLDHETTDEEIEREERLPLFAMPFSPNGNGSRKLLAGLIPVANRERYEAAPRKGAQPPQAPGGDELADARFTVFKATVVQALAQLSNAIDDDDVDITVEAARDLLLFGLLDLADVLEDLEEVRDAIESGSWSGSDEDQEDVFNDLSGNNLLSQTWLEALKAYTTGQNRNKLLEGNTDDVLPVGSGGLQEADLDQLHNDILALGVKDGGAFYGHVETALGNLPPLDPSEVQGAPPAVNASAGATYVIRCVYERPRCARFHTPSLVSAPSRRFQLASYFDPDAPARPLRVTLPVDTSVGGFRNAAKGVSFLFSKQLREQMDRIKDVNFEDLDNQDIPTGGGLSIGMICSFSIPIITICAMILLMIIIQLLNIVFWWLPFFRICFPIPVIENE